MTLFDECIEALGRSARVLTKEETDSIFNLFEKTYEITFYGRIDWKKESGKEVRSVTDIKDHFTNISIPTYILWDNARIPAVEAQLDKIIEVIDDVTALSFDTWLFSPELKAVIEFSHDKIWLKV
ncbi:CDI toxin immunity protein [Chengkuizengella marina]|uniref:Uncharacterized protein n=1 Tax=Chengkuizengella marina TaxID=2507566 RepID=A0A6N9Q8J0_9BACL|nr:hypothetical protein [Chengkuizengella marina]NBI31139.1 hypothetical protein [Chengkuizengella marina]